MFKKPIKTSAKNQLSGKDRKSIKSKLLQSLDNHCVEKIFQSEEKISCWKVQGSKMLIYEGEQYPLLVDGTGKNNFFPSLYLAIAYQPLIKSLIINQGVEAYIYNGANLMWPGVRSYQDLGDFSKDETVGIRSSKGEMIAIGAMGCSKKDLTDSLGVAVYILHYLGDKLWQLGQQKPPKVIVPLKKLQQKHQNKQEKPNQQQKPLQKVQQSKDKDDKSIKQINKETKESKQAKQTKEKIENQKIYEQKKQKTPEKESQQSDDDAYFMRIVHTNNQQKGRAIKMEQKSGKIAFDDQDTKNTKNKKKNQTQKGKQKSGKNKKSESEDEDVMEESEALQIKKMQKDDKKGEKKTAKQEKKQKNKNKNQSEEEQTEEKKQVNKQGKPDEQKELQKSAISSQLMDQYFRESFLNAIKLAKIQQQLPIDTGRFFMDFMLIARPPGVKLQIKESSYKKIGKFFEDMAKKKIIQYKHPKDKKVQGAQITKIFWENQDLKDYVPTIKKMGSKDQEEKVQTYSKAKLKLSKSMKLQTVYKPSQELFKEVFKKPLNLMPAEGEKEVTDNQQIEFVTEKQLRQAIQTYLTKLTSQQKQKKQEKDKQVKKTDKTILLDYTKHEFLKEILKKQIQQHEENKEKEDILKAAEGSDQENGEKKKKKTRKGALKELLKIDKHYLAQKLIKEASSYYHVSDQQTGLDIFKQGTFKGIQIIAEKANNKNITRILGLQLFIIPKNEAADQIQGFAHSLQTRFACSVNVQNLPSKNAGKQIIVHGAFLDQLEQILTEQYELQNKFISTQNKFEKKKKN